MQDTIEQRRITRLYNETQKRDRIMMKAEEEVSTLIDNKLWLIGNMLYWAEGGKSQRGLVRFSNADPKMLQMMMSFFREHCHIQEEKFRGHIHIHSHLNYKQAEIYWSEITGIPKKQFFKTYRKYQIQKERVKDSLPYGTMDIYVCNTELFLKIQGWILGIVKSFSK